MVKTIPFLWVGAAQAWLKPDFVYPYKQMSLPRALQDSRQVGQDDTDLPVHMSHGAPQALQVVHQVVLQLREHLAGVCLLQSNHHSEGKEK